MYRTTNIVDGRLVEEGLRFVSQAFHEANRKSQLVQGDVLIARFGDMGLGAEYKSADQANCLNCIIYHPNSRELDTEFFVQLLASPALQALVDQRTVGSTFSILNTTDLGEMEAAVPAIDEQKRIGGFFAQLDNLITLHQRKHQSTGHTCVKLGNSVSWGNCFTSRMDSMGPATRLVAVFLSLV